MINVSICLSDLPKEKITLSEKNGKKYINLIVDSRKEPDQYGQTHTVYVSQSKDERENKEPKKYVGNGKEYVFKKTENAPPPASPQAQNEQPETDYLPF